jgi:hypothetical protein
MSHFEMEMVVAWSRYSPRIILERLRTTTKIVSIVGVPAEIWTDHLLNTSIVRYRHANLIGWETYVGEYISKCLLRYELARKKNVRNEVLRVQYITRNVVMSFYKSGGRFKFEYSR